MVHIFIIFFHLSYFGLAHQPQADLMNLGDSLLEKKISLDEYHSSLQKISNTVALSTDDLDYLKDLREKLPPQIRREICPDSDGLGCGHTLPPRPESPLVATAMDPWEKSQQPIVPTQFETKQKSAIGIPWWGFAILGAVVMSYEMRGKEFQIQRN